MKIKYKIALYYSVSAVLLLIAFAAIAYYFSSKMRKEEYQERLEYRARSIANVIIEDDKIKVDLLRKLDKTTFQDLYQEKILVYDQQNVLVYSNLRNEVVKTNPALLTFIWNNKVYRYEKGNKEYVGIAYTEGNTSVIVIASSLDKYGYQNLQNLEQILVIESLIAIIILIGVGYWFARKIVQPLDDLVLQVNNINASTLEDVVVPITGKDEIALLANNFNTMIQRLSRAFDLQKSFVSNASHELRTPLASIISQLQVMLTKDRSNEEYKALLESVLEDSINLSDLTNGLLQLAQSDLNQNKFVLTHIRIDELLLDIPRLLESKLGKTPKVEIEFRRFPDQEYQLTVNGNESLLKILFLNLVENACKFSADHSATVFIDYSDTSVLVSVADKGLPIPEEDAAKIFEPFFRASNALQIKGHGLGLSICKKIVLLHKGDIMLINESPLVIFQVTLPTIVTHIV